jgi:shikimate kinase
LKCAFIDVDTEIERRIPGNDIKQYVEKQGWPAFRELELVVFKSILEGIYFSFRSELIFDFFNHISVENKNDVVISCGGGIVETEKARSLLVSITKSGKFEY